MAAVGSSERGLSTNLPCLQCGPDSRLLTAFEVAALLAVPESWVRDATRSGVLPAVQLGKYVRYRFDDITTWIHSQENRRNANRSLPHAYKPKGAK